VVKHLLWVYNNKVDKSLNIQGLTSGEVETLMIQNKMNKVIDKTSKSNWHIFKDNVLTLFNLFNLLIGIALALVGAFMQMAYLVIILANVTIGIIQEVRGRKLVEGLKVLYQSKIKVLRDGKEKEISPNELVLGDVCIYSLGNQIACDSIVLDGEVEVNEALLTGESEPLTKKKGDKILSGSFVVSGRIFAKTEKIGADNFANSLIKEAKKPKKNNSDLLVSMRKVTKVTSFFIVPLGVLLFVQAYFFRDEIISTAVITSAAALLGMLPKGLVFLTSIALATGVVKLSKKKVLVQQMHGVETLAHVDVLCLDKTGTITTGEMSVEEIIQSSKFRIQNNCEIDWNDALGLFAHYSDDENPTMKAIKKYVFLIQNSDFGIQNNCRNLIPLKKIPFSSSRKYSQIDFKNFSLILGSPEKLVDMGAIVPKNIANSLKNSTAKRVLFLGIKQKKSDDNYSLFTIHYSLFLNDPIRKDAKKTLEHFRREGVSVKIISGDSVETCKEVAKNAGFHDFENAIDMSKIKSFEGIKALIKGEELKMISENNVKNNLSIPPLLAPHSPSAKSPSIFARVSPEQKQLIVRAFRECGHTVAFSGDGVNDILALREADCAIGLSNGSDAARQVSELVLGENNFSALPEVLNEGRRVANNITKAGSVFFIKVLYSVALSVLFAILNAPFPFIPIQITLIDLALEAYPAFFLSFEKNDKKLEGKFLKSSLLKSAPFAIAIILAVAIFHILYVAGAMPYSQSKSLIYLTLSFITIAAVFRACLPFNKLRLFLALSSSIGLIIAIFLFRSILHFEIPNIQHLWILPLVLLLSTAIFIFGLRLTKKSSPKKRRSLWKATDGS